MSTKLPFNPDQMTVKDLKDAAGSLRALLQRYELLEQAGLNDTEFAEQLYSVVAQIADQYEVV